MKKIEKIFEESIKIKNKILLNKTYSILPLIGDQIVESILTKGKLLICGNGGSAADAQHLAAELLIRLRPFINRNSIPAITLATDSSTLTACGNDYSFDNIYERILFSLGNDNDSLLVITTSGNSKNIIKVLKMAKKKNIKAFGFLGNNGGLAKNYCDESFIVPSNITGRIQESHITAGHALMEYIEDKLIKLKYIKKL